MLFDVIVWFCVSTLIFFLKSIFFFFFTVNQRTVTSDLNDLQTTIQDIRSACQKMPPAADDRFAAVMSVSFPNQ